MNDIMEKVRWIIACEFGETGNPAVLRCLNRLEAVITPLLQPEPPKDCIYRDGGCCCDCDKAPCDQMPKFSKPKAERVEEVAEILDSTQSWARYQTGQEKFFRELAEQIVATEPSEIQPVCGECGAVIDFDRQGNQMFIGACLRCKTVPKPEPRAMGREEMEKIVAERLEVVGWNDAAKNLRLDSPLQPLVPHRAIRLGATFAIEALCNQIPASEAVQLKEEAEVWKKKYEWCKEYCVMPDSLPAKGSDRLDKVIAVVNKWLDATE